MESSAVEAISASYCDNDGRRIFVRTPTLAGLRLDWVGIKSGDTFSDFGRKYIHGAQFGINVFVINVKFYFQFIGRLILRFCPRLSRWYPMVWMLMEIRIVVRVFFLLFFYFGFLINFVFLFI